MEQANITETAVAKVLRSVVRIDRDRCDGCGVCAARCPEGALRIVDGRAELAADSLCDGVGFCVGVCPSGAVKMERREAALFDWEGSAARRAAPHGGPAAEFQRRLTICCRASKCGRLCPRLIKQPGRAGVWCVDIQTGSRIYLYEALADPAFKCPQERF